MAQLLVDLWPLWVTLGAVITVAGWSYAMHAKATWSWTLAQAVITHISKVDQQEPFEPGDSTFVYSMQVGYTYHVGDVTFRGSQPVYSYGHIWHRSRAPDLIRRFKPGKTFQVRYCPDEPQEHSAKGPKNPGVGYGSAFFGATTVIAGIFLAAGGMWLRLAAIGVAAVGVAGALIFIAACPRGEAADGLSKFLRDEP